MGFRGAIVPLSRVPLSSWVYLRVNFREESGVGISEWKFGAYDFVAR